MKKKIVYELNALYRDNFRVTGYEFGEGEDSVCIVGNIRGNEIQQIYTCSQLVKRFKALEEKGKIKPGKKIMVIPSVNPYSVNIKKRFWPTDNTDINRMFPGYDIGETTQRIAAGIFEAVKGYRYGMQFTSFYMPGTFIPHVRMMVTGYEDVELAKKFGLPYVVLRKTRPYDTTTLNYNWQIWETRAFSMYTASTERIDKASSELVIRGILNFLSKEGIVEYRGHDGYISQVVYDTDMVSVRTKSSGLFDSKVSTEDEVDAGQLLAEIIDPYEGEVKEQLFSPVAGRIFFAHDEPMTYASTAVFKIVAGEE